MRPALFHPWIYLKGGIERTLLELVTRSRHDWQIYTGRYMPDETFDGFRDLPVIEIDQFSVERKALPVAKACYRMLRSGVDWSDRDALMISCDGVGNLMTLGAGDIPKICLCHTPLRVAYEPTISHEWRRTMQPGRGAQLGVKLFTVADRLAWRKYDHVFCVSGEVRNRIEHHRLVPSDRLEVLHPGVDITRFVPTGRRERFFLIPGRIMWAKNIELGIEGFIAFKDHLSGDAARGFRLIIAGAVDEKSRPYVQALRATVANRDDVEFVESPDERELLDLYDRCLATVFPPLNEDWGLVPLESMAFGKPVIAVNRGGPAESVIPGRTGFLCAPTADEFAAAMSRIAGDTALADEMGLKARAQAERFHWTGFVERIDAYLDRLAESRIA